MAQMDEGGLPISLSLHEASAHEVTLAFDLVTGCRTREMPGIVVGDKAYDSDPLDDELGACGVEVVAPHRRNRKKPATQDEEGMKSHRGRWKVERFFAWLQRFRRLVVRYERYERKAAKPTWLCSFSCWTWCVWWSSNQA